MALAASREGQPLEAVGGESDPAALAAAYAPLLREAAGAGEELGWGGVRSLGVRTDRAVAAWAATAEDLVGVLGPADASLAQARWAALAAAREGA